MRSKILKAVVVDTLVIRRKFFGRPDGVDAKKQQSKLAFKGPKEKKKVASPEDVVNKGQVQDEHKPKLELEEQVVGIGDVEMTSDGAEAVKEGPDREAPEDELVENHAVAREPNIGKTCILSRDIAFIDHHCIIY